MTELTKQKKSKYFDYLLLFIVLFLLAFGLVMVYSINAYTVSADGNKGTWDNVRNQVLAMGIGIVVMLVVSFISTELYRKLHVFIYIFSILSILLVLTPLGYEVNGATRWIKIREGLTFQPAEIAKIGVIIFVATILTKMKRSERNSWKGVLLPLFYTLIICALIVFVTSNLSSAIIIGAIAFCMICMAEGLNYRTLIIIVSAALVGLLLVLAVVKGWGNGFLSFRGERILAWLHPEEYASGKGYQTIQALYGIGSGGVFGKGLGKSMQKLGHLPESQNDMIFSIICEELGLFGGLAILVMFLMLLFRILDIAQHTQNEYDNLLLTGIFAHLALQVIMNVAVVTGLMPNTGISLPFISQGGTSVVFLCVEIGIVMRIARNCSFEPQKKVKVKKLKNEEKES